MMRLVTMWQYYHLNWELDILAIGEFAWMENKKGEKNE